MQIGTITMENVQQFLIKLKISIPPYPRILYLGSQMKDYTRKANNINKIRKMVHEQNGNIIKETEMDKSQTKEETN